MITGTRYLKMEYESTRLCRYGDVTQNVRYDYEDVVEAYLAWANHPYGREHLWDSWCDLRDGVPRGTNARFRKRHLN